MKNIDRVSFFTAIDKGDMETIKKDKSFNELVILISKQFNKHDISLDRTELEKITVLLLQKSSTKPNLKADIEDSEKTQLNDFSLKCTKKN